MVAITLLELVFHILTHWHSSVNGTLVSRSVNYRTSPCNVWRLILGIALQAPTGKLTPGLRVILLVILIMEGHLLFGPKACSLALG